MKPRVDVPPTGGGQGVPLISVRDVKKRFGPVRAVDGVSLDIAAGEVVALLGPNGAGKTTLIRMLIGMVRPDSGALEYHLSEQGAASPDPERIGYLPEERGLYTDVPVMRVLLYLAALRGMAADRASREAMRWLHRVGLEDRAGEPVRNLSKGNQQKIQFVSSVLHGPDLAILDEPFSGLDPVNQDLFVDMIRELRDTGATVLLSAHQMELIERLADRVVLLRRGRVVSDGSIAELRRREGAGRMLRLRVHEPTSLTIFDSLRGVRSAAYTASDQLDVLLEDDARLSDVLQAIGGHFDVRDIRVESLTLHDIYVRSVSESNGVEEVAA